MLLIAVAAALQKRITWRQQWSKWTKGDQRCGTGGHVPQNISRQF